MYHHKILYKFYSKYLGGDGQTANDHIIPNLVETDIMLIDITSNDYKKYGGINPSKDIARQIHKISERLKDKNNISILGIYSKDVKDFIFPIDYFDGAEYLSDRDLRFNRNEKIYSPVYRMGTYTAVYSIYDQNKIIKDSIDDKYILRVYQNNSNTEKTESMFNDIKIKKEYNLFYKVLSKIYYHGMFTDLNVEDTYPVEYNITKQYNTPTYDGDGNILNMTNRQKFNFLLSNVAMLYILYENNYIHADYKLANVGWDDSNDMNVILLDYDIYTLQKLESANLEFEFQDDVLILKSPSTYIPEYIRLNGTTNTIKSYDKYSVGGLNSLIRDLKIEFSVGEINLDRAIGSIDYLDLHSDMLGYSLRLESPDYDDIPIYIDIYNILMRLSEYVVD
jgi:hypothetical protein